MAGPKLMHTEFGIHQILSICLKVPTAQSNCKEFQNATGPKQFHLLLEFIANVHSVGGRVGGIAGSPMSYLHLASNRDKIQLGKKAKDGNLPRISFLVFFPPSLLPGG